MIETQNFDKYPVFGEAAAKTAPDAAKYSGGFIAADVLPAEWLNWAWAKNSKGISDLNAGVAAMEAELNAVLEAGGIVANNTGGQVAGAIKKIILEKTGTLTNLNTANKETIVAACNELLSQIRQESQQRQAELNTLSQAFQQAINNEARARMEGDRSIVDFGDPSGNHKIQVGFEGNGLTAENTSHLAGFYNDGKGDRGNKIRNISKEEVLKFLNLNVAGNGSGMLVPVVAFNANEYAGYIKLGNGLIIQWGSIIPSHGKKFITIFPCSFTTKNYAIVATVDNDYNDGSNYDVCYFNKKKTHVSWYTMHESNFSWIAIGI